MTFIKEMSLSFIKLTGWMTQHTPEDTALRADIVHEIELWNAYDNHKAAEMLADTSCSIAEKMYGFTTAAHRRYIALYTACSVHVDDVVNEVTAAAVQEFGCRFVRGEAQCLPALDRLAALLRDAYTFYGTVSADAIVTCTIDAMAALGIEYTTQKMEIVPRATRWPAYLRLRTGFCATYAHFMFMKGWRQTPETYLQILP